VVMIYRHKQTLTAGLASAILRNYFE